MQARSIVMPLLIVPLLALTAQAEPPRVVVGETGLTLDNSAVPQDKYYLEQNRALGQRISCLLQDVDRLLAGLHALPPEWQGAEIQAQPVTVDLQGLIDLALQYSPELKPMRTELAVLAAKTRQAGARMDPMLGVMWMDIPGPNWPPSSKLNDATMSKLSVTYSQTFDSYGKRDLKRGIAHLDEKLKELELAEMERRVIGEVTDAYFMLVDTQARLRVMATNIDLMKLLLELAEQKFSLGFTPQAAVLNMQVELTQMERERIDMQQMLAGQHSMLAGMLGFPAGFDPANIGLAVDYPLPADLNLDVDTLRQAALDRLPDYQQLRLQQTQQGLMLEMARREYRPDYTLTAGYEASWKERDMLSAGIMVPLSLNKKERQDAQVQEAYAMQQMLADQMRVRENTLQSDIAAQRIELERRGELIEVSRVGLVPQARLALDSNIDNYAANMMDLSDLVMAQQTLLNAELELEQNYIAYLAGMARLQVLTGGAFDPAPYLAPSLASDADQPVVEVPDATHLDTDGVNTPFVDALGLPDSSAQDSSPVPEAESVVPAVEALPAPEARSEQPEQAAPETPSDSFYDPYQPRRKND